MYVLAHAHHEGSILRDEGLHKGNLGAHIDLQCVLRLYLLIHVNDFHHAQQILHPQFLVDDENQSHHQFQYNFHLIRANDRRAQQKLHLKLD